MRRSTFFIGLLAITEILTLILVASLWQTAHGEHNRAERYKHQSSVYYDEALKSHVQYEGARNENQHLQRDLADAQERLAQAAERERSAKVRASRSRRAEVPVPVKQHESASLFRGGVHDITMYCPTGNRTASGKVPQRGMVATISRSIPFGTHVLIEGLGEYVVEDRIGHGSEFDIFTPSCSEADRFGREHRRVTILDVD